MSRTFTYSASGATANGVVDAESLIKEINDDGTVGKNVQWLSVIFDLLTIRMQGSLDSAQEAGLDAVVAAHQGIAAPSGELSLIDSEKETFTTSTKFQPKASKILHYFPGVHTELVGTAK